MSLIRVRRRRKQNFLTTRKGMAAGRLAFLFVLTVVLIWYLGWRY
jgi:hypothetical protein